MKKRQRGMAGVLCDELMNWYVCLSAHEHETWTENTKIPLQYKFAVSMYLRTSIRTISSTRLEWPANHAYVAVWTKMRIISSNQNKTLIRNEEAVSLFFIIIGIPDPRSQIDPVLFSKTNVIYRFDLHSFFLEWWKQSLFWDDLCLIVILKTMYLFVV